MVTSKAPPGPEVTPQHIQARVDDWKKRIDGLYDAITEWLPKGWEAERRRNVLMNEELMQKKHVQPVELHSLILHGGKHEAVIEPRALWIIGANGRLDLVFGKQHYVIVDMADYFKKPQWKIAPLSKRQKIQDLNSQTFKSLFK